MLRKVSTRRDERGEAGMNTATPRTQTRDATRAPVIATGLDERPFR
jgi:hypothetical protein